MTERPGDDYHLYELDSALLRIDYNANVDVGEREARFVLREISRSWSPRPIFVDIRKLRSADRRARKVFASQASVSHVALFVDSPLSRMLANVFLTVAVPERPTRMFTDEAEALAWLRQW